MLALFAVILCVRPGNVIATIASFRFRRSRHHRLPAALVPRDASIRSAIQIRTDSTGHATERSPNFTGGGNRPSFTRAYKVDRESPVAFITAGSLASPSRGNARPSAGFACDMSDYPLWNPANCGRLNINHTLRALKCTQLDAFVCLEFRPVLWSRFGRLTRQ